MKKIGQIVNHGTLTDSINWGNKFRTDANQQTFLGASKKVVNVKVKSKGNVKTLKKVRSSLK